MLTNTPIRKVIAVMNLKNVPKAGIEPARPDGQQILSLSCLPIPPLGQILRRSYVVLSLLFCSCTLRNSPQEQSVEFRTIQALQVAWQRGHVNTVQEILSQEFEHPEIYWAMGARLFTQKGRMEWSLDDLKQGKQYALQCIWEDSHFRNLVQINHGLISAQSIQALDMSNESLVECGRWLTISWALMVHYRGNRGVNTDVITLKKLGAWLRMIPSIQNDPWTLYADLLTTTLGDSVDWNKAYQLIEEIGTLDPLFDLERIMLYQRHVQHEAFCQADPLDWAMLGSNHQQRLMREQYSCR